MNWLTIDPGISGTGLAWFNNHELAGWINIYPKGVTWLSRTAAVLNVIRPILIRRKPMVFIEWPTGRFSSAAGLAAQNTDAILKLTFLIGRLFQLCGSVDLICLPTLLPVQKWKGQLPKKIVKARAERFFQQKGFKAHAADAVGIGQYVIEAGLI